MLEKKPKFLTNEDILKNSEELLKLTEKIVKKKKDEKVIITDFDKNQDKKNNDKRVDIKKFEGSDIPWYI